MIIELTEEQTEIAEMMAGWLENRPVYLDTETTGLGDDDKIVEISIVDNDGVVLFDTLVNPEMPIPDQASSIHGITDEMVKDAPRFVELAERIWGIVDDRQVIIYNAKYDTKMIAQSGAPFLATKLAKESECAMNAYAVFNGEWNDYHGNYRWVRLSDAAQMSGVELPENLHRAKADAELTRRVVQYVGGLKK